MFLCSFIIFVFIEYEFLQGGHDIGHVAQSDLFLHLGYFFASEHLHPLRLLQLLLQKLNRHDHHQFVIRVLQTMLQTANEAQFSYI